jgi:hypothetical protein
VGVNAYWNTLILFGDLEAGAFVRFYPWDGTFFAEAAVGYHVYSILEGTHEESSGSFEDEKTAGVALTPALGWKIDVGNAGGFYLQPGMRVPITFGVNDYTDEFEIKVGFVPYFA